jgi:4-hydroxy-3-polyprenylbenzoate decarboxylase
VLDVSCHEIAVDSWIVVRMRRCNPSAAWQALYAVAGRNAMVGKMIIAVDEDIDPADLDAVVWALSYRMQPHADMVTLPNRSVGLDPSGLPPVDDISDSTVQRNFGSAVLVNAMRKWDYPPVSLPAKEYMENARKIWEELQLPALTPRAPWHGYELGEWSDRDREEAEWAVKGEYIRTGDRALKERKAPEEND